MMVDGAFREIDRIVMLSSARSGQNQLLPKLLLVWKRFRRHSQKLNCFFVLPLFE